MTFYKKLLCYLVLDILCLFVFIKHSNTFSEALIYIATLLFISINIIGIALLNLRKNISNNPKLDKKIGLFIIIFYFIYMNSIALIIKYFPIVSITLKPYIEIFKKYIDIWF